MLRPVVDPCPYSFYGSRSSCQTCTAQLLPLDRLPKDNSNQCRTVEWNLVWAIVKRINQKNSSWWNDILYNNDKKQSRLFEPGSSINNMNLTRREMDESNYQKKTGKAVYCWNEKDVMEHVYVYVSKKKWHSNPSFWKKNCYLLSKWELWGYRTTYRIGSKVLYKSGLRTGCLCFPSKLKLKSLKII